MGKTVSLGRCLQAWEATELLERGLACPTPPHLPSLLVDQLQGRTLGYRPHHPPQPLPLNMQKVSAGRDWERSLSPELGDVFSSVSYSLTSHSAPQFHCPRIPGSLSTTGRMSPFQIKPESLRASCWLPLNPPNPLLPAKELLAITWCLRQQRHSPS